MSHVLTPFSSFSGQIASSLIIALLTTSPMDGNASERYPRSTSSLQSQSLPPEIDHVMVYQQGAQVERISTVELAAGHTTVTFSRLNTGIDPAQLRLTGDGEFQVLSISPRYHTDTLSGESTANRIQSKMGAPYLV